MYAADTLYREAAYISYLFHWSLDDILDMEHPVRQRFVQLAVEFDRARNGL
jgi:hypothetical protein